MMAGKSKAEIGVETISPAGLSSTDWMLVQTLLMGAFESAMPHRSQAEIEYLFKADNLEDFIATRLDPQAAVDQGRMNPNQSFKLPLVSLAHDGSEILGYLYAADNVSGRSVWGRKVKMTQVAKRYAWLREAAVAPSRWGQGIGRLLVTEALKTRHPEQRVTAYAWTENKRAINLLRRIGFETPDGPDEVTVFGPESRPAEQWRLVYPGAGRLLQLIDR